MTGGKICGNKLGGVIMEGKKYAADETPGEGDIALFQLSGGSIENNERSINFSLS